MKVEAPGIEINRYSKCLLRNTAEYQVGIELTPNPAKGSLRHTTPVMDTSSAPDLGRAQPAVIRGGEADDRCVRCPGCDGLGEYRIDGEPAGLCSTCNGVAWVVQVRRGGTTAWRPACGVMGPVVRGPRDPAAIQRRQRKTHTQWPSINDQGGLLFQVALLRAKRGTLGHSRLLDYLSDLLARNGHRA